MAWRSRSATVRPRRRRRRPPDAPDSARGAWVSACARSAARSTPSPPAPAVGWSRRGCPRAATRRLRPAMSERSAQRPLTIVLVDDQPLVRAGIAFIVSTEPGIVVASEAGNGELGLVAVTDHRPDVVL